ncbi:MAG TPA: CDP-alcohol phosphatidyltransferase family protein [Nitrososphaerales archaeon]|nr:CDP-alcohol phosphatidyltransferase family protein [Nitrososphaerales archaeon]
MLDRLRARLESNLQSVGKWFARLESSPTAWTVVGLLISILAGAAYSTSGFRGEVIGGVLVLVAGWFDIVDGAVARVTGRTSRQGAFLDSTLDRVAEVAVFAGMLLGGYSPAILVLLALSFSLLVSYTRAKGDALGVALSGVGIGERSERLLILAVLSIVGLAYWGVLVVIIVALYTFLERTMRAVMTLKGSDSGTTTDQSHALHP